jgi:cephalosporin-C deacetylase-like acetyl esterase
LGRTLALFIFSVIILLSTTPPSFADTPSEIRTQELAQLRQMLPASKPFDDWLAQTGELPRDFDALPTSPCPQDILTTLRDGKPHRVTKDEWPARRAEMRQILEQWFVGHAPPAPGNVRAIIENKFQDAGLDIWQVRLEFGPDHAAILHCWLFMSPKLKKPAPVFLVDNFKYKRFAADALEKGTFAVCVYNAPDPAYVEFMPKYVKDRKDESDAYKDLFGNYDWSEFYRRGWSASRAVDWLSTLNFIDARHIYIGGHSRSAKQAMVGAAFDDRIAGVIASSPGSGGSLCYRYCDQYYYGESAELLTRVFPKWVSPKVRFFVGRENKLPGDMHFEYALLAPRPVLMSTATNDDVENTWAVERTYDLAHPAWELLGEPGNLAVRYRPGPHAPDDATYHAYSEFLEAAVAGKPPATLFPYQPIHVWNYDKWLATNKATPAPPEARAGAIANAADFADAQQNIRQRINWLLGNGPAYAPIKPDFTHGESDEEANRLRRANVYHQRITFGDHINGNLYRPTEKKSPGEKSPAIIWLAPFQTSTGYVPGYKEGDVPYTHWVTAGYIVLAFDPIATGGRQDERRGFYDRNPHWSLMGKMVVDARNAIDAVLADPQVDPHRVYLVGFAMGGMTAAFTAALDDRIAGAASIAGFTPFRTDTDASGTGGIRRWSELYGWLPNLGTYIGQEQKVPVDFAEILSAAAPRPMLVIAPTLDWHANHADVANAVGQANAVYHAIGAKQTIRLESPQQPCQFDNAMQAQVMDWLSQGSAAK